MSVLRVREIKKGSSGGRLEDTKKENDGGS